MQELINEIRNKCFEVLKLIDKMKKECLEMPDKDTKYPLLDDEEENKKLESDLSRADLENLNEDDHDCHLSPEDGCDCQK